jgi:hypothetical protein
MQKTELLDILSLTAVQSSKKYNRHIEECTEFLNFFPEPENVDNQTYEHSSHQQKRCTKISNTEGIFRTHHLLLLPNFEKWPKLTQYYPLGEDIWISQPRMTAGSS